MGKQLPAIPVHVELEPTRRVASPVQRGNRRWLRSPVADALVDVLPDLLRLTRRMVRPTAMGNEILPASGANGMTVQEVEIEVASPLVRRITIRSTNAWSLSPEVALAGRSRRGGRIGIGAVSVAGLLLLGAAARRASSSFADRSHRPL